MLFYIPAKYNFGVLEGELVSTYGGLVHGGKRLPVDKVHRYADGTLLWFRSPKGGKFYLLLKGGRAYRYTGDQLLAALTGEPVEPQVFSLEELFEVLLKELKEVEDV